ncbi:hypothetical protein [Photobacterium galatheae]|uniref:Uncharacterized protein n=1 Tax=Photobacterium galatheae TaxID=1654360 RepID=A0A066RN51_9GAMM|nr:hypothetical protein [Photobacterium galatheae]KDM90546.1 hypothetical protein EA58_16620 [Photobacterium galatheae]MCM0148068.1 hypothetical protein [Photobacterium galatheae]
MVLALTAMGLIAFYLYFSEDGVIYADAILAAIVTMIYAGVHYYFASDEIQVVGKAGFIFTLMPLASLGVILFPNLNDKYSESTSIILGWIGLIASFVMLILLILMI